MVYNTNKLKEGEEGVLNDSIPSAFVDSAATSNVVTKKDRARNAFVSTGQQSDKALRMPNRAVEAATAIDKFHHELPPLAKDLLIVPAIKHNLLLSIPEIVDANYIAILDKYKTNIRAPRGSGSLSLNVE
jgi:hypothetical protein